MKWLLLGLLLLEFDFEKKKLFFVLTADFIMPFVFFGQVTRYLKHPAASLLQINTAFCFHLPRPDPCLPCHPHLSHVSIFVGSAGERGNRCGGFKGDNLVFVDILLFGLWQWFSVSVQFCPISAWLIFLSSVLQWESSHPQHGALAFLGVPVPILPEYWWCWGSSAWRTWAPLRVTADSHKSLPFCIPRVPRSFGSTLYRTTQSSALDHCDSVLIWGRREADLGPPSVASLGRLCLQQLPPVRVWLAAAGHDSSLGQCHLLSLGNTIFFLLWTSQLFWPRSNPQVLTSASLLYYNLVPKWKKTNKPFTANKALPLSLCFSPCTAVVSSLLVTPPPLFLYYYCSHTCHSPILRLFWTWQIW